MVTKFIYTTLTSIIKKEIIYFLNNSYYLTFFLRPSNKISVLLLLLKKFTPIRQTMLTELTVYDSPFNKNRFTLVYFLLSVEYNNRICIKIPIKNNLMFESITNVFLNASWSEREVRDMYGVFFAGNGDLRRLLTDYGFEGFPLRKDFPLTGYIEVRYDDELQRILYEPVELTQEYRIFSLSSPWEIKIK